MWNRFKVNNEDTRKKSLLLTLNRLHTLFWCFFCWLWTNKCRLESFSFLILLVCFKWSKPSSALIIVGKNGIAFVSTRINKYSMTVKVKKRYISNCFQLLLILDVYQLTVIDVNWLPLILEQKWNTKSSLKPKKLLQVDLRAGISGKRYLTTFQVVLSKDSPRLTRKKSFISYHQSWYMFLEKYGYRYGSLRRYNTIKTYRWNFFKFSWDVHCRKIYKN